MRAYLFMLMIAVAAVAGCRKGGDGNKTTNYSYTGVIKGQSPFMTQCGGAYWIEINGVNARTTFNSLPAGSGIDLATATYPMNVKLNWHYEVPNTCFIIVIDGVEQVN